MQYTLILQKSFIARLQDLKRELQDITRDESHQHIITCCTHNILDELLKGSITFETDEATPPKIFVDFFTLEEKAKESRNAQLARDDLREIAKISEFLQWVCPLEMKAIFEFSLVGRIVLPFLKSHEEEFRKRLQKLDSYLFKAVHRSGVLYNIIELMINEGEHFELLAESLRKFETIVSQNEVKSLIDLSDQFHRKIMEFVPRGNAFEFAQEQSFIGKIDETHSRAKLILVFHEMIQSKILFFPQDQCADILDTLSKNLLIISSQEGVDFEEKYKEFLLEIKCDFERTFEKFKSDSVEEKEIIKLLKLKICEYIPTKTLRKSGTFFGKEMVLDPSKKTSLMDQNPDNFLQSVNTILETLSAHIKKLRQIPNSAALFELHDLRGRLIEKVRMLPLIMNDRLRICFIQNEEMRAQMLDKTMQHNKEDDNHQRLLSILVSHPVPFLLGESLHQYYCDLDKPAQQNSHKISR